MVERRWLATILLGSLLSISAFAQSGGSVLKYGDGQTDGKRSLGRSGELIKFALPTETGQVSGIRIHGSRYGEQEAPDEDFQIYILNEDLSEILYTEMAPYRLFQRDGEKWIDVKFKKPRQVPKVFWIGLDFRAHSMKGVYVSYDTSTGGQYSKIGLPGLKGKDLDFAGDWMIQVEVSK